MLSVFRFLIFSGILLYCAIWPALYFVGPQFKWYNKADISYAAIMYYLVFNTLFLIGIGYCIVGSVTYPYSNGSFSNNHRRTTNQRFGSEFVKCTERICRVLQDMIETQGTQNTSAILTAEMNGGTNEESAATTVQQMNNGEIYTRVASNIELIGLYLQINEKILSEPNARPSRLFRSLTNNLAEIKQTLDRIELRLSF